jgi:hypothetical protein
MIAITKDFPVLERLTMEIVTPFVDLLNSAQVPSTTDLYFSYRLKLISVAHFGHLEKHIILLPK